jgi:hypothetical protein
MVSVLKPAAQAFFPAGDVCFQSSQWAIKRLRRFFMRQTLFKTERKRSTLRFRKSGEASGEIVTLFDGIGVRSLHVGQVVFFKGDGGFAAPPLGTKFIHRNRTYPAGEFGSAAKGTKMAVGLHERFLGKVVSELRLVG